MAATSTVAPVSDLPTAELHRELADPHRVLGARGETTTAVKVRVVYAVNGYGPNVPQATKAASARSTTLTAIFIASCRRA